MALLDRLFRRGMSCTDVLEVLQSYLDDETDLRVARRVAAHLDRCGPCERESHTFQRIKESLGRRRRPVDPEVLAALADYGQRLLESPPDPDDGPTG